jgi:hypothetical protein
MDVDGTGHVYVGYSDTRVPGAVSLPGFVRQASGPALLAPSKPGKAPTATTGQPALGVSPAALPSRGGRSLASTGPAAALPALGGALLLLVGAAAVRRRTV